MHVDEFVQGSGSSPGDELVSYSDCLSNAGSDHFLLGHWAHIAFGTSPRGGRTSCCCEKLAALPLLPNETFHFCAVLPLFRCWHWPAMSVALTPSMKLLFEIHHLRTATPATVSRAGILYVNPQDLGWNCGVWLFFYCGKTYIMSNLRV